MPMTIREARLRLSLSGMRLSKQDAGDFRVSYAELPYREAEPSAYYTDDLEDAVLTGAAMRAVMPLDVTVRTINR